MMTAQLCRKDFPLLEQASKDGRKLIYLDNAASTQKCRPVIEAINHFYLTENANIHRGVHYLSTKATDSFERARTKIATYLNAEKSAEIVFVRGATEAINLVAHSWGRPNIQKGDEILLSVMEHHANIIPWQQLAIERGATLKVLPINDRGELLMETLDSFLSKRTKIMAIAHVSNVLGTINPIHEIIRRAHSHGIPVLIDGAQSIPHFPIDVRALDCDFFVFSGHKIFAPTGIGVLYGKAELLRKMPPYQCGGSMVERVTFDKTTFQSIPTRFEAGTPHICGAIGLAAAIEYLQNLDKQAHEKALLDYTTEKLKTVKGLQLIGEAAKKVPIFSFLLEGVHPHDIGTVLDGEGIAIRAGHHCAQPLMKRFGIPATARVSLSCYNTFEEIDKLTEALQKTYGLFHKSYRK